MSLRHVALAVCVAALAAGQAGCSLLKDLFDFSNCSTSPSTGLSISCSHAMHGSNIGGVNDQLDIRDSASSTDLPFFWQVADPNFEHHVEGLQPYLAQQAEPSFCWAAVVQAVLARRGYTFTQCDIAKGYSRHPVASGPRGECAAEASDAFAADLTTIRRSLEGNTEAEHLLALSAQQIRTATRSQDPYLAEAATPPSLRIRTELVYSGEAIQSEIDGQMPVVVGLRQPGARTGHVVLLTGYSGSGRRYCPQGPASCRGVIVFNAFFVFDPWPGVGFRRIGAREFRLTADFLLALRYR